MRVSPWYGTTLVLSGIVVGLLIVNCASDGSQRIARAGGPGVAPWNTRLRVIQSEVQYGVSSRIVDEIGSRGYLRSIHFYNVGTSPNPFCNIQIDGESPQTLRLEGGELSLGGSAYTLDLGEGVRFEQSLAIDLDASASPPGWYVRAVVVYGLD